MTRTAATAEPVPRSLVWATELDVLPVDRVIERRSNHLVVRSPGNPTHYWGNLLLFDEPPAPGDGARWERAFEEAFGEDRRVQHRTFAWDRAGGVVGAARDEFLARGYLLERSVGLAATPVQLRQHPRANREVVVRALEPSGCIPAVEPGGALVPGDEGGDAELWRQVVELQVAGRGPDFEETSYRMFIRSRLNDLRVLFAAGRGSWYVALTDDGIVSGSCGIVVTGTRARFQTVDTAAALRRRGICSRLIVEAAHDAARRYGAERLVIVADPDYHALGIYESLGFERRELVAGVYRPPASGLA